MKAGVLALILLLALPPFASIPAQACATSLGAAAASVPCGRIYPIILLNLDANAPKQFALKPNVTLDIPATVTYRFDAINDGYAVVPPTDPITISFEYPRKPSWADLKVDPETIPVNVDDPTQFTPNPDPSAPTMQYSYTAKITIHATLRDVAILRDGYDYAKLLVFAKSSENGLYQAGYGIKEIRVLPQGALHESDVASLRDVFTASPLPAIDVKPVTVKSGGTSVTVTPPSGAKFWDSQQWKVKVSPAPGGQMLLAMHDEWGNLEAVHGPVDGSTGDAAFNATLAKPGLHTVTVTLLPAAGSSTPPQTFAVDLVAGTLGAQGYQYLKTYVVDESDAVPAPVVNTADPTMQWERDVPFYAFDSAQSVSAVLTLTTPGADALGRGASNIQFSLLDPDGNSLGTSSVDPSKPQWPLRIGSVPSDGWYTLRLRGAGAPMAAAYDAHVEVDYAAAPQERNHADGRPDLTPPLLARGGRNLTLPLGNLSVWKSSDFTPKLDHVGAMSYQTTVDDANGALVYASGVRAGASALTPPAPGVYRAFVYTAPALGSIPFAPTVRVFTFAVDENRTVTAQTFPLQDAPDAPTSPSESLLAAYAVPVLDPNAKLDLKLDAGARGVLTDADGKQVDKPGAPGTYYLRVYAANPGPEKTFALSCSMQLPSAATLVGPEALAVARTSAGFTVPGLAVGGVLLAVGAVAVGVALFRRR
jgi:hypothetical protein